MKHKLRKEDVLSRADQVTLRLSARLVAGGVKGRRTCPGTWPRAQEKTLARTHQIASLRGGGP